jgi:hypothetical protein
MYTNKILVSKAVQGSQFCDEFLLKNPYSLIYVLSHNSKGAVGIMLNGPSIGNLNSIYLKDVVDAPEGQYDKFKQMYMDGVFKDLQLYLAGPRKTKGVYFLHGYGDSSCFLKSSQEPTLNDALQETIFGQPEKSKKKYEVVDGVFFGTPHTFAHIVENDRLLENKYKFFTGETCWVPGQLETEVQAGFWAVVDYNSDYFFDSIKCENLAQSYRKIEPNFFSRIKPSLN